LRRFALAIFSSALSVALLLPTAGAGAASGPAPSAPGPTRVGSGPTVTLKAVPRVLSCLGLPEVRPANYLMSCADANASWKNVKWHSWGLKSALGTGDLYQNDCQPNCVSGRFRTYAAKVVLSGVTETKRYGLLYSKATFSYSVNGKHESETFGLAT